MATKENPLSEKQADITGRVQAPGRENKLDPQKRGEPQKDAPIFFDSTISKMVKRENEDGDTEWVEVMSDNLYPGEILKSEWDAEHEDKKAEAKKKDAESDKDRK